MTQCVYVHLCVRVFVYVFPCLQACVDVYAALCVSVAIRIVLIFIHVVSIIELHTVLSCYVI